MQSFANEVRLVYLSTVGCLGDIFAVSDRDGNRKDRKDGEQSQEVGGGWLWADGPAGDPAQAGRNLEKPRNEIEYGAREGR